MPSNIEIKAKVDDLERLAAVAEQLAGQPPEILVQEDTFFVISKGEGRLKLRVMETSRAELIYYERPDTCEAKQSIYQIVPVPDPVPLRNLLSSALGESITVRKTRRVYLVGQTRVHLDEVEDLGDYLELEVVLKPDQPSEEGQAIAATLIKELGIRPDDLVSCAYADLLRAKRTEA